MAFSLHIFSLVSLVKTRDFARDYFLHSMENKMIFYIFFTIASDKYDLYEAPPQTNGNYSYDRTSVSQVREPEDSMMSSKTRSLLDKVKESTAALSNMNSYDEFDEKPSR